MDKILTMPLILFCLLILLNTACTPASDPDPLSALLKKSPQALSEILAQKDKYQIQILYTQIERDANNYPHLYSFGFNLDTSFYFYPASSVKMPVAFLALQRINELNRQVPSIDIHDILLIDSSRAPQRAAYVDSTTNDYRPTIARYVEKIFVNSDNDAHNRLYEFLGQDYINDEHKKKGIFTNSVIRTRLGISGFDTESNKYTNAWKLQDRESGQILAMQDEYYALYDYHTQLKDMYKGRGYYSDAADSVIMQPFDMSEKNFFNLIDMEASLRRIIFPHTYPVEQRYDLSEEQYKFLYECMPKKPRDFDYLSGHDEYYDSYVKFFVNGDSQDPVPDNIKIYNKVGWAYGTVTDCSYIIDTASSAEFFLTATINVNENGIYNDGTYAYKEVAMPFFTELGRLVMAYEIKRPRKHKAVFETLQD